jgi:hypothetical protein
MSLGLDQTKQEPSSPKKRLWRKIRDGLKKIWGKMLPGPLARKGAAIGILFFLAFFIVAFGLFLRPGLPGILDSLVGIVYYALMTFLIGLGAAIFLKILAVLPSFINKIGLVFLILLVGFFLEDGWPPAMGLDEKSIYGKDYKPTMQTFDLPLAVFSELYPEFNPGLLKDIRFVFDQGREGVIVLDNIGFTDGTK